MSIPSKWALALWLPLLCVQFACATEAPRTAAVNLDGIRQAFVAAMQRIRLNLPETPDPPALEAYAIHDYLTAARFRRDLTKKDSDALDAAIDQFLQAHAGQPVSHGLRHDWLMSLAQRHRWDIFLSHSADVTDPLLVCHRLEARLLGGDTEGLGAAALARWSLPQRQLPECNDVFKWLRQQNFITPALAEAKVRATLAADNPRLAREFAVDVPVARAAALLQWSDLLEAPKAALTVLATHPALAVEPEALATGFEKLAHTDSAAALDLLPLLVARPDLTPALQARLRRAAALGAAYDRDPRALSLFDGLAVESTDNQVEEWRVRAALWTQDYGRALDWIERMPPSLAAQPRWRYWRARAVAATAGSEAAAPLFEGIADLRDYYGYLAADRLHRGYHLNARPTPDDLKAQNAIAAEPGLIRAHELFACDMTEEATVEWTAGLGAIPSPARKIQAAHLASRWGWYAQSIATLAQAGEWDDVRLRYPRPYPDAISAASELARVSADWILSVMRQESLYRKDAVSRADARGLMQMRPATAAAVARRWHLPAPRADDLFDPSVAIPLGAAYLRELIDRFAGQLGLSLAAYNAGPVPVTRWLPSSPMEADVWVENIPYAETRSYVQHILEHIVAFAFVSDTEPPRLDALMPPIEPAAPPGNPPAAPVLESFNFRR
ncbi:MAG TPA: transglycosylase SLT domain-containing protein [Steroidobacteraceae bacterium]|jgi:soluble lytic murein transglycosylase|nr:transglycosylase SLT domain-containing protein [Steroidobacteraceae bacterium]